MIWIDRLAIVWAGVYLAALCLFSAAGPHTWLTADMLIKGTLIFVGGPWLLLRGIRWIVIGGISRASRGATHR